MFEFPPVPEDQTGEHSSWRHRGRKSEVDPRIDMDHHSAFPGRCRYLLGSDKKPFMLLWESMAIFFSFTMPNIFANRLRRRKLYQTIWKLLLFTLGWKVEKLRTSGPANKLLLEGLHYLQRIRKYPGYEVAPFRHIQEQFVTISRMPKLKIFKQKNKTIFFWRW